MAETPSVGTIPLATGRLQLHRGFTFDAAAEIVPYLSALGVSHVYSSPILTARAGSAHGYDIVDHGVINPELGGEAALRRLVTVLRRHGMGLIVDIVPNHMAVGGGDNDWWLDVLEWGRASPYAKFFDIDWEPADSSLHNRILVPFLGAPYGKCLESGEIRLRLDPSSGRLAASYHEHVFPIAARHYAMVFGDLVQDDAGRAAEHRTVRTNAAELHQLLSALGNTGSGEAAIKRALARFDATDSTGRQALHDLLERQHYRLAWWRAAADEINWRRFFEITSLAGLRVELPAVFDATHALILRLYGEGLIDGVRVDHIDGLADPRGYCRKLRRRLDSAGQTRPATAPAGPPYIVVEKILAPRERLPSDWLTDGTTGYDFMDQVGALLHDPAGADPLSALWQELSGSAEDYAAEERAARRLVLRDGLASELNAAALALRRIGRRDLATRDYTLTAIRRALTEILVHFPVYRLYAGVLGRHRIDDQVLATAMAGAKRTIRAADHPLLDLIGLWLGGVAPYALPAGPQRRERVRAVVRFEQLSSPVAAKAMEDTAFYRYGRLLSRNEVGADPSQFALSPAAFHAACRERLKHFPAALLATATHDHKRGEDVRARIAVLSEISEEWGGQLRRWMRLNMPLRRQLACGQAPDPADEMMLYQMLVGAWPIGLGSGDAKGVRAFLDRISVWQEKALREAKHHTAWIAPDETYETACREFLLQSLDPARTFRMVDEIAAFARRIGPPGAINGLTQTLLHLTTPGVPDLFQGTELWDLSLVDPDNRRPVDFELRRSMLPDADAPVRLSDWRNGAVKQALIARLLNLRREQPALFSEGRYMELRVNGRAAKHIVAFGRQLDNRLLIVAGTYLSVPLLGESDLPLVPEAAWADTRISLPRGWAGRNRFDVLDGSRAASASQLPATQLFAKLPVAVSLVS